MINNLKKIAAFIMNHADGYNRFNNGSYYVLDAGVFRLDLYIIQDQYSIWINEKNPVTFRDDYVERQDYLKFMKLYMEVAA